MPQGGPSQPTQRTDKLGRGRPLAAVGCALRGGHDYIASRRFEGFDTCTQCGHRRRSIEGAWFSPEDNAEKPLRQARAPETESDAALRPLAMMGCALRRGHTFVPSRRLDGYDTCMQCGYRRKSPDKTWFAVAPPRPAGEPAPVPQTSPDPSEPASVVIIPFAADAEADATRQPMGVDPKVLKRFLNNLDRLN